LRRFDLKSILAYRKLVGEIVEGFVT
jgi:hypothetical protein